MSTILKSSKTDKKTLFSLWTLCKLEKESIWISIEVNLSSPLTIHFLFCVSSANSEGTGQCRSEQQIHRERSVEKQRWPLQRESIFDLRSRQSTRRSERVASMSVQSRAQTREGPNDCWKGGVLLLLSPVRCIFFVLVDGRGNTLLTVRGNISVHRFFPTGPSEEKRHNREEEDEEKSFRSDHRRCRSEIETKISLIVEQPKSSNINSSESPSL